MPVEERIQNQNTQGISAVIFAERKVYLDTLEVLHGKFAGHLYCLRFEDVLDAITIRRLCPAHSVLGKA